MHRTITAYFDRSAEAQVAADRLAEAGIPRADVSIHDASSNGTTTRTGREDKGFWASLTGLFMPDEDRYAYSEGIRRGGSVLSVETANGEFDRASDILEDAGAVDLDTREAEWRSQGWSGYDATATSAADGAGIERTGDHHAASTATDGEGYLPVAEEQLHVGKREVDNGHVRIRSYVHETPVEEHVRLRDETVDVDRRPVDRAASAGDDLFEERAIEAEEHKEEPVVSKEARVVEEVRLKKEGGERDETIHDTVRRSDVEVEDERAGRMPTEEERNRRGS